MGRPAMTPVGERAALFVGAAGVRLAALGVAVASGRFPEFWEYEHIALNLIGGKGFVHFHMGTEYRAYVEPLYPWLVAGVYLIAGHRPLALAVVQSVIAAAVAVVIYELARHTFGRRAALAAGALVALHPALAGYASKFHPLVLDTLFLSLVALATVRIARQPNLRNAVLFGAALGGCVLTRPTVLAFVPPALAWVTYRQSRRGAQYAALGVAIATLVVGPWVARNYVVLGTFVLTRTNTGYVFWLGNNPGATGGATDSSGTRSLFDVAPLDLKQKILSTDEVTQNRIFLSEALAHVRQDPAAFLTRTVTKLYYFWWGAPYSGRGYSLWHLALYQSFYVVSVALAALGLLSIRRQPIPGQSDGVFLGLALLITISVVQSVFYVDARHRLAVEPLLMVFSGQGVVVLLPRRMARAPGPPGSANA